MIDTELLDELSAVAKAQSIDELSPSAADQVVQSVAASLLESKPGTWWWTSLREESFKVDYTDEGLSLLAKLLDDMGSVCLVATDDEPPPWPVFEGPVDAIIELVSQQRFFEYFVTAPPYDWAVFDTHHNLLVAAGVIVTRAKSTLNR